MLAINYINNPIICCLPYYLKLFHNFTTLLIDSQGLRFGVNTLKGFKKWASIRA